MKRLTPIPVVKWVLIPSRKENGIARTTIIKLETEKEPFTTYN